MKMRFSNLGRAVVVGCAGIALLAGGAARAETACDDANIVHKLPKLPDGCQSERISASGNQRPTLYWAQKSTEDHWQDQVINKYGERFSRWDYAACAKTECGPSALVGFSRCTYSGFPCATKPDSMSELSRDEIREMQRLLTHKGFRTKADGKFGEKTHAALQQWQRSQKLTDDGLPTHANLEALRKA